MMYYVHYLHFSDYCPHLCRHVYHNVSAVVRSGLLQAIMCRPFSGGWNVELNPLLHLPE